MKLSLQCRKAAKSAWLALRLLTRTVGSKRLNVFLLLFEVIVRPHLECVVQAWRPYLIRDRKMLKQV